FTSGGGGNPSPTATTGPSPTVSPTSNPTQPPPGNGVVNGGFETGTLSPWTCSGTTGSVVSSPVHSGTRALQGAATNSDNATCTQNVTVLPNHTYTLSAWVRGNYAFIGTTGAASNGSTFAPSAPTYVRLSVSFTTGSATTVQIFVHGWYAQG